MASKHLGCEDLSSDIEYAVVVDSENDFNVNSKEERIKDEPVENEPSSEFVCDDIYLEQGQDEKWCTPEFVKLEELRTEDVDDNLKWKTENAELIESKSETGKETPNEDKFEEEGTGVKTASEKLKRLITSKQIVFTNFVLCVSPREKSNEVKSGPLGGYNRISEIKQIVFVSVIITQKMVC
ncbi:hypothetical protein JTB14_009629 [Gonioctena quinquepunctata]|nr:hypothetical protein JTB14_009629 [Gonioctena quinquepunctata]